MLKINDVFFDLDRTLWDFERNSEAALRILFEDFQLANHVASADDFIKAYRKVNSVYWKDYSAGKITKEELKLGRFRDTLKVFSIEDNALGALLNDTYIAISPHQKHLFPYAKETLEALRNQNFRLHIITNGFKNVQHLKLEHSGLMPYFDEVLCSEEVGENKPHPVVFQEAMRRAGAKANQSVMIGDDLNSDIIGAENVGIRGILFDPHRVYQGNLAKDSIVSLKEIPSRIIGL